MPCRGELSDLWKQCELESQKKKNPVLVDLTLQRALSIGLFGGLESGISSIRWTSAFGPDLRLRVIF